MRDEWVERREGEQKKKRKEEDYNGRAIECVNLVKMSVGWLGGEKKRATKEKKNTAVNEYYITIITEMIIIYLDWM